MTMMTSPTAAVAVLLAAAAAVVVPIRAQPMPEDVRMDGWRARNYTWPFQKFVPDTPGWRNMFEHRFRQVAEIENSGARFEGYIQSVNAAVVAPNFTEHGFGLARAPDDLMEALRQGIQDGLKAGPRTEPGVEVIEGKDEPWFIDRPDLTQRVLEELQHYPETWAGLELIPFRAYGFRLYRNESVLNMHVDKSQTHVISFILHIDSSEDSEPWPILIEDFKGQTHEVILKSGDMLFYESSKCFHGRPHKFNGSWYSSVFVHYYPKYGWAEIDHGRERFYAVPPHWNLQPPQQKYEIPLQMVGTSMKEPTCPNEWCATQHTIKWSGPAEEGFYTTPTFEKIPFHPAPIECRDNHPRCSEWAEWTTNECTRNSGYMLVQCKKSCGACTVDGAADEL